MTNSMRKNQKGLTKTAKPKGSKKPLSVNRPRKFKGGDVQKIVIGFATIHRQDNSDEELER
jgi:hypothetical protein